MTEREWATYYAREVAVYEEDLSSLQAKARSVADIMRGAVHCVVYTGAGISTAANIPGMKIE